MNIVKLQDIKSTHRNPLHSYTLIMKKTEREIKEIIPFTIAMKRIKYLGIYLSKETKELYIENYKTLVKEILFVLKSCYLKVTFPSTVLIHSLLAAP